MTTDDGRKEDIIYRFQNLRASEYHNIFSLLDRYYDNRVGLHTYVNGNIIRGYYENGRKNTHERLESCKVWFYGNIVEESGVCQFRGIIFCSTIPIEFFGILLGIIRYINYSEPFAFLGIIIFLLYRFIIYKEEYITYEYLEEVMGRSRL